MTTYDQLLAAVTTHAEDDAARSAFAAGVRASDPDRAKFIDDQLAQAKHRRAAREYANTNKHPLLVKHEAEWTRTIAKYTSAWVYDRGFVTSVDIDPDMFLEYGEWLLVNAPIRVVRFTRPEGAFPIAQLAASPLLARLDVITFSSDIALSDDDLLALVRGHQLSGLLQLAINDKRRYAANIYDAFAASAQTRKLLRLFVAGDGFPGQAWGDTGDQNMMGGAVYGYGEIRPEGHTLEQKYGYLPWIHAAENSCEPLDARYFVDHKILPVKPPGSRA